MSRKYDIITRHVLNFPRCKCSLMNMQIDITIKARDAKMVKSFVFRGPHTLRKAILWIWREVFVSLLAHGNSFTKSKIPEMIEDRDVDGLASVRASTLRREIMYVHCLKLSGEDSVHGFFLQLSANAKG